MSTIHMQTDEVRQAAREIERTSIQLRDLPQQLRSAARQADGAWDGGGEALVADLYGAAQSLEAEIEALYNLAGRLSREVGEWESADSFGGYINSWGGGSSVVASIGGNFPPGDVLFRSTLISVGIGGGAVYKQFDWGKWGGSFVDLGLKGMEYLPYDGKNALAYKNIGRYLNHLVGNQKAGYVGKMDKLGHFVKSPVVQHGIPLGMGIAEDLMDGDSVGRAVGSELIEGAINYGISAIPVVGQVYAVYQIGLAGGHLIAGGMELFGLHEEAAGLENTLELLDFSDQLGDAIYDFADQFI